jgi:hypothetical protein
MGEGQSSVVGIVQLDKQDEPANQNNRPSPLPYGCFLVSIRVFFGDSWEKLTMYILGISAFYHDSAACLVQDGEIVAAAQEERFTRKKHDPGFPRRAVE